MVQPRQANCFMCTQSELSGIGSAAQVVHELLGAKRGCLVVGHLVDRQLYLIALLRLPCFKQRFPEIHLQVHAQPSSDIVNGPCQLPRYRHLPTAAHAPLHDDHRSCSEERLALIAPTSMSIGKSCAGNAGSARLPLVLMPVDYCLRKMVEAECAKAGVHPQVVLEMSSPEGILQAVAEGTGATISFRNLCPFPAFAARLQVIDLPHAEPHPSGWPTSRNDTAGCRRICDSVSEHHAGFAGNR